MLSGSSFALGIHLLLLHHHAWLALTCLSLQPYNQQLSSWYHPSFSPLSSEWRVAQLEHPQWKVLPQKPVLQELDKSLKAFGEAEGYEMIWTATSAGNLVYTSAASDVTDDLLAWISTQNP